MAAPTASLDVLERLVCIDTTSRESNLDLIRWVEEYLDDHGVESRRVPSPDGRKAGLIARVGPEVDGGILLSGHTDTVPVDGQRWTGDPFVLRRAGDRVVARGVVDMKGFIASALALVPHLVQADLQAPVWIGLTYDEEVGCLGAAPLADALLRDPVRPAVGVIGEATEMAVVQAHKGVRVLRTVVSGKAAHSSLPDRGASAIMVAARVVTRVEEVARDLQANGVRADGFDPPTTTMNVGTISGGTALNIIPASCELVWEFRYVPGEDPDAVLAAVHDHVDEVVVRQLRRSHPEVQVVTELVAAVEPLDGRHNDTAAELVAGATGAPRRHAVAYGTDGGALQAAGIPCVVFGPGEPDQMHQPDESLALAELEACDRALRQLIDIRLR